jgi:hypothetical protein
MASRYRRYSSIFPIKAPCRARWTCSCVGLLAKYRYKGAGVEVQRVMMVFGRGMVPYPW